MTYARGSSTVRACREGAFTLVELLVVLGIVGVLAGIGVGVLMRMPQRYEREHALTMVSTSVYRARAAALESGGAVLQTSERELHLRAWDLRLFHTFDASATTPEGTLVFSGARSVQAVGYGVSVGAGALGSAAFFDNEAAYVGCGNLPALSPVHGFRIDMQLFAADLASRYAAEGERGGRAAAPDGHRYFRVLGKGDQYSLWLRDDFALVGRIGGSGQQWERATPPDALEPDRWHQVRFAYSGSELAISVDGFRLDIPASDADSPLPSGIAPSSAPFELSIRDPYTSFFGGIDSLELWALSEETRLELPEDMRFATSYDVRFDCTGGLDRLFHDRPIVITIERKLAEHELETHEGATLPRTAEQQAPWVKLGETTVGLGGVVQ